MKILAMSDLHLEFDEGFFDRLGNPVVFDPDISGVDVLVLAGDIHVGTSAIDFIKKCAKVVGHVIYVLGNHEFYHHDLNNLEDNIRSGLADVPNVHLLERQSIIIDGVRFLGTTLWTDFGGGNPMLMMVAGNRMNDYALIKNEGRRILPRDIYDIHCLSVDWLRQELEKPFDGKTVVVTHHLPDRQAVHANWRRAADDLSYSYFCTDCLDLFTKVDLWIFGHQHESIRTKVDRTLLMSNPRGYMPYALNDGFDVYATVEL